MDEGGNQTTRNRNRQSHKTLLINLRRAFRKDSWPRRLHVETRQSKCTADQVHERNKPRELMQMSSLLKRRSISPDIREHRRREAKSNYVSNRVELNTNLSGSFCESRDAAVEHVKQQSKS